MHSSGGISVAGFKGVLAPFGHPTVALQCGATQGCELFYLPLGYHHSEGLGEQPSKLVGWCDAALASLYRWWEQWLQAR